MKNAVLLNINAVYRKNNFIYVGSFYKYPIYMGIDKFSFVSDITPAKDFCDIYKKFDRLTVIESSNYNVSQIKVKHYRRCIKITSMRNPDFYMLLSYDFSRKLSTPAVRFELSPQYARKNDIPNVIKWLKKHIGGEAIDMLFQNGKITRMDMTLDIHGKQFLKNFYFSIPNAKTGKNFLDNEDNCKHNYAIGSKRSSNYLLVYEKLKVVKISDVCEKNIRVKKKHIKQHITRLELRIKPLAQKPLLLSEVSMLENPFNQILIYRRAKIAFKFQDFLHYIKQEKSLPLAISSYMQSKENGDKKENRNTRLKMNRLLEKCKSKFILNIEWAKYPMIIDNTIRHFIPPLQR